MPKQDRYCLAALREQLLDTPFTPRSPPSRI
jgi:hypothetical protein